MTTNYIDGDGVITDKPFFKTPYNHDRDAESRRTALTCLDESKAIQSAKEETDINTIVNRFLKTGELPNITLTPQYGDFTDADDYKTSMERIAETNALFYKLPAAIRASYQNDPAAWQEDVLTNLHNGKLDRLRAQGIEVPDWANAEATGTGGDTPPPPKPQAGGDPPKEPQKGSGD